MTAVFYAPLDFVSCVRRTLKRLQPQAVIILETEIWPALYSEVKRTGAALVIVNGRISDKTWPTYERWRAFFCPILRLADAVLVQSVTDFDRYGRIGVLQSKLFSPGNLKFDAVAVSGTIATLPELQSDALWIAASTVGPDEGDKRFAPALDEDDVVLNAWQQLLPQFPRQVLLLAPRQPKRFQIVAAKLKDRGIPFASRSQQTVGTIARFDGPGVLLIDTIGELASLYPLATVVFVGGSLAPRGGHNILEPAAAGAAVIVGPHVQNFAAIVQQFKRDDALIQIQTAAELAPTVAKLLQSEQSSAAIGQRAKALVQRGRGGSERVLEIFWPLYHQASFRRPAHRGSDLFLGALASAWTAGGRIKRERGEAFAASLAPLPIPVISIGGITIGGSGKTPFTAYLAKRLRQEGQCPAILTRGYRRQSPAKNLVFGPGTKVPIAYTGDEAQIFLRAGHASVGIGASRYRTAEILLSQFPDTSVFLLDDGFQHSRLKRNLDIVVIDGMDPFGGEAVVPVGRLREPLTALARADVFVVNRAEDDGVYQAICHRLHELNQLAPVFRTRLAACVWRDYGSGVVLNGNMQGPVAAFCGLGNPRSFWRTLQNMDIATPLQWEFPDHHSYKPIEIRRMAYHAKAQGLRTLVTTEKDLMNLPQETDLALGDIQIAWLSVEAEVENEAEFLHVIRKTLH